MFRNSRLLTLLFAPRHNVEVNFQTTILRLNAGKPLNKWNTYMDKLCAAQKGFLFVLKHMYFQSKHIQKSNFVSTRLLQKIIHFNQFHILDWIVSNTDHFSTHAHHLQFVCDLLATQGLLLPLQKLYDKYQGRATTQAANQAADAGFLDVLQYMAVSYKPAVLPSCILKPRQPVVLWIQKHARIVRCFDNNMIIVAPSYLKLNKITK